MWQIVAVAVFAAILVVAGGLSGSWIASAIVATAAGIIIAVPAIRVAVANWIGHHWRIIFLPIVGLAVASLLIAVYSPAIKKSMGRWHGNVKQTIANSFDKKSLKSEPENGIYAYAVRKCPMYNSRTGTKMGTFKAGEKMLVLSLEAPNRGIHQGTVLVMAENADGDFIHGTTGQVAIENLTFDGPPILGGSINGMGGTPPQLPASPPPPTPLPPPAPAPPVAEPQKDVSGLPLYDLCVGDRKGPCLGDYRYDSIDNTFYSDDGRVKMRITCLNSTRQHFLSGNGVFAGDSSEQSFRAARLNYR